MLLLSVLAPMAVLASDMPRLLAWPLAVCAILAGLGMARREAALPVLGVLIDAEGGAAIDGAVVDNFRIDHRGPLVFVAWHDAGGHPVRRSLWPDTLPPASRRELRLAIRRGGDGQAPPSMAP